MINLLSFWDHLSLFLFLSSIFTISIDRSTFPCSAKGFGPNHGILSVPEGQVLVHGQKLICDHDECKASKRSFLYCAFGNHAVAYSHFHSADGRHKCLKDKILCKRRNVSGPISHSGATLSHKRGEVKHGGKLTCSHEKCRNSGKSSLYCAYCKEGVPKEKFSKHKCM